MQTVQSSSGVGKFLVWFGFLGLYLFSFPLHGQILLWFSQIWIMTWIQVDLSNPFRILDAFFPSGCGNWSYLGSDNYLWTKSWWWVPCWNFPLFFYLPLLHPKVHNFIPWETKQSSNLDLENIHCYILDRVTMQTISRVWFTCLLLHRNLFLLVAYYLSLLVLKGCQIFWSTSSPSKWWVSFHVVTSVTLQKPQD